MAGSRDGWTWRVLSVSGPTGVAAVAAWALVADDKVGWTVASGCLAAVAGAFAPSATSWWAARRDRPQRTPPVAGALVAELPAPVAWLLHPQLAVVGFFGRGWELKQLETWSADPDALAVRLMVGGGGVGKTRLAWHFAERRSGWAHWPVAPQGEPGIVAALRSAEVPDRILLTVDYAETREPRALAELLCVAQQTAGVRVLLLARRSGLWWETLSAAYPPQAHLVDALTAPGSVIEVPARVEGRTPEEIIAAAVVQFAAHLGRIPPAPAPIDPLKPLEPLEPETPVLRLHAEALLAVLSGPEPDSRHDVLAEVLGHEARYWRACARRAGLAPADVVLRQLVGIAALLGAADDTRTAGLVRRAPLLAEADGDAVGVYAGWLRSLYPADGSGGPLGTLQPDLLAETLAVEVLCDCAPDERTAVFQDLTGDQAAHALLVLGRAAAHRSEAGAMIDVALAADVPRMTEAVLRIGPQFPGRFATRAAGVLETAQLDPRWAGAVVDRSPSPSLEFSQVALAVTTRILAQLGTGAPASVRAAWLNRHVLTLTRAAQRDEALPVAKEALKLYRELAATDRGTHLPGLATALRNVAFGLADAGRTDEALTAGTEAVALFRELAADGRVDHLADLALSVTDLAAELGEAGRRHEALAASTEAVAVYHQLAAADRTTYLAGLATSVNNLAVDLAQAGRRDEALAASAEAVAVYHELAATDRGTYLDGLATSVSNLAADLAQAGRREDAARAGTEAVRLYRRLAATDREAYLPHLADALNNCAVMLARIGRRAESLAVSTEAVHLRRDLAGVNGRAYLPALAASLTNHTYRLAEAGRVGEAMTTGAEAVALHRELADDDRPAHRAGLALSLWNVGVVGLALGQVTGDVLAMAAESVQHFGDLAAADPGAFGARHRAAAETLAGLRRRVPGP